MLTDQEVAATVELLQKFQPGILPREVFFQIARLSVQVSAEVVPLRIKGSDVQVLLLERESDDPFWQGMLHVPGAIVIPTDAGAGLSDALGRVMHDELKLQSPKPIPVFVETLNNLYARGRVLDFIHWVDMENQPETVGKYYNVRTLPDNLISQQADFIRRAAGHYEKYIKT